VTTRTESQSTLRLCARTKRNMPLLICVLTVASGTVLMQGCSQKQQRAEVSVEVRKPPAGQDLSKFWDDMEWQDLNSAEQALWGRMGWTESKWQEDSESPPSESQDWKQLTDDQRDAARALGFDEAYWDSLAQDEDE